MNAKRKRRKQTPKESGRKGGLRAHNSKEAQRARTLEKLRVANAVAEGKSFAHIADELGMDASRASQLWREYEAGFRDQTAANVEQQREAEVSRLESLGRKAWTMAMNAAIEVQDEREGPDGEVKVMKLAEFEKMKHMGALYLKTSERRALLLGLDAPKKMDLGGALSMKDFLEAAAEVEGTADKR